MAAVPSSSSSGLGTSPSASPPVTRPQVTQTTPPASPFQSHNQTFNFPNASRQFPTTASRQFQNPAATLPSFFPTGGVIPRPPFGTFHQTQHQTPQPSPPPPNYTSATVFPNSSPSNFAQQGYFPYTSQPTFFPPQIPNVSHSFPIKLGDSNYLVWKNQILNVAYSLRLEGFINGTIPPPPQYLDNLNHFINPEFSIWEQYNRTVMSWFYSSLTEEKVVEIVSYNTARDI